MNYIIKINNIYMYIYTYMYIYIYNTLFRLMLYLHCYFILHFILFITKCMLFLFRFLMKIVTLLEISGNVRKSGAPKIVQFCLSS